MPTILAGNRTLLAISYSKFLCMRLFKTCAQKQLSSNLVARLKVVNSAC